MKSIIFKKIIIKNFLSVGSTPIEIEFKTGLNVITGANKDKEDSRNGVGKSTVADAIFYSLFGNPLRDIKKEEIGNDSYNGSCELQLFLDVISPTDTTAVQIIRKLDPSSVNLFVDGMDKTLDSIANTDKAIGKLLNCNAEVFESCVIMTLNNSLPFMCRKKQDKRKFIESIFNLEVFGKMLTNVKADYNERKSQLEKEVDKKNQIESTIRSLKAQEMSAAKNRQAKIDNVKLQIKIASDARDVLKEKQTKLDLEALAGERKTLTDQLSAIEPARVLLNANIKKSDDNKHELNNKLTEIRVKIQGFATAINITRNQLDKINSNEPSCPVCLRDIKPEDIHHIEEERLKLQNKMSADKGEMAISEQSRLDLSKLIEAEVAVKSDLEKRLQQLGTIEAGINSKISRMAQTELEGSQLQQKIDLKAAEITGYEASVTQFQSETTSFDTVITEQQGLCTKAEESMTLIKGEMDLLEKVKFVCSEEGVKSYLVKQILDLFNNRLAYYLQKMDANCVCTFNEYFEETLINDKGKSKSYFSFSGAERKKIDLACLFTFMDICRLQGDVSFNISIYDELLDSSLDSKGVELVVEILKERVDKYKECIYIISHRKESTKLATGDVIYLQKNNGITTRLAFHQSPV